MFKHLIKLAFMVSLAFSTIFSLVCDVYAQTQAPVSTPTSPSNDQLDALYAAHNWNALGKALTQPISPDQLVSRLDWLKAKIDAGSGFFLVMLYKNDLWNAGMIIANKNPNHDLRASSAMMALYAYELIVIDGAMCADQTAPGHRMDQLISSSKTSFGYLKNEPDNLKNQTISLAIALEKKTAPLRQPDDLLCSGGLDQMKAGLEKGTQHEVSTPPGQFGRTVYVTPPEDYQPKFLSLNTYKPIQDKDRAEMPSILGKLAQ